MKKIIAEFIYDLEQKLTEQLPGKAAQLKLEPPTRRNYNTDPENANAKLSSVLILFFPENGRIKLALIQRPEYDGVHSGQIAFPGGKKEEADKSLMETALRETFEEIGVLPEKVKIIGKLSQLYIPPSNFLVEPFVGFAAEMPDFKADPTEVSEIVIVDLDDLLDESSFQFKEITTRGFNKEVPCYFVSGKIVWGATSMIISELIDVIKQKQPAK
jgi:8-oxo-dGTP pyrophosphatase MutT (NUDIX family)